MPGRWWALMGDFHPKHAVLDGNRDIARWASFFPRLHTGTPKFVHLNKLKIMDKTTLIIIQVTIGKKKVELPDLNIISPGNCPNPSFFM